MKQEVIKEKLKVWTEFFKVFLFVIVVLAGAVYGLLLKLPVVFTDKGYRILIKSPFDTANVIIFVVGLIFLIIFAFAVFYSIITVIVLIKRLNN